VVCPVSRCGGGGPPAGGMTRARSPLLMGLMRIDNGMPAAAVRWRTRILAFPAKRDVLNTAFAKEKRRHPRRRSAAKPSHVSRRVQAGGFALWQRPLLLPAQQPSMRGTLGGPLEHTGEIAPVAACEQHVEQGIEDLAKQGMWPTTTGRRPPAGWPPGSGDRCTPSEAEECSSNSACARKCCGHGMRRPPLTLKQPLKISSPA
jgi:hypothetical protein